MTEDLEEMSLELRRGNSLEERVWLKELRRRKQKKEEGTQAEGWPRSHGNHTPTAPSWARRDRGDFGARAVPMLQS